MYRGTMNSRVVPESVVRDPTRRRLHQYSLEYCNSRSTVDNNQQERRAVAGEPRDAAVNFDT